MTVNILGLVIGLIWLLGLIPIGYEMKKNFTEYNERIESQQKMDWPRAE